MIVGEIRRYLRDNSAIRVSRSMRDTAYKVMQARERLMAQSQREPTVEQLAAELGIPREDVVFALDAILESLSAKKDDQPPKKTAVRSMAELSETIDSLDKDDPRKEQLTLLKDRLQQLGIYADLDVGVKDEDESWETLTGTLIREEAKEPDLSDII